MDFREGTRRGRRRDAAIGAAVIAVAIALAVMPTEYQRTVREAVRGFVLRPFISLQTELVERRRPGIDVDDLQAQRDSLLALVSAQHTLSEENRRLRALLGLQVRAQPEFVPAELIRVGGSGPESSFILTVGRDAGVVPGSPVIAASGLVGVVWEVTADQSQGIDWTHPEFRASAMTGGGEAYGIVEPRRGRYREEDQLALTGAPFHVDIRAGTRVVTSGRGGVFPRGIPLGTVVGIEEADTGWRKSYLVRPAVRPEAVAQVLVGIQRDGRRGRDFSQLWHVEAPPDPALLSPAESAAAALRSDTTFRVTPGTTP